MKTNGELDVADIVAQFQELVKNYQTTIQKFGDIYATLFKMLVDKGLMSVNEMEGAIYDKTRHLHIDKKSALEFYKTTTIGSKKFSNMTPEAFADWIAKGDLSTQTDVNGKVRNAAEV